MLSLTKFAASVSAAFLCATMLLAEEAPSRPKPNKNQEPLSLPIPKGQPQQGVKIPLYDTEGRLRFRFEIGVGTWIDEENIKLSRLRIETFTEDGNRDLDMDLPDAVLNQRTNDLTSKVAVTVRRSDFEITGNQMTYNLTNGIGTLGGGVKMKIFNLKDDSTKKAPEKTKIELKPAANTEEKK